MGLSQLWVRHGSRGHGEEVAEVLVCLRSMEQEGIVDLGAPVHGLWSKKYYEVGGALNLFHPGPRLVGRCGGLTILAS